MVKQLQFEIQKHEPEAVIALAVVGFMIFYPPEMGALLCCAALTALLISNGIRRISHALEVRMSPDVLELQASVKDLKLKVEQLVLRAQR